MILAIDYEIVRKAQRQHSTDLLNQLAYINAAVQEVCEQQQALLTEHSTLLQEQATILQQLFSREEQW